MRRTAPAVLVVLLLLAATILAPATARADTIATEAQQERTEDPTSITFTMRVNAPAGLESATLVYKVLNPDGNVGGSGEGAFAPGAETDVSFTLETRTAQRYIPVGSDIVYHWELVDRDGATFQTAERDFIFLDGRYNWQSMTEDAITVYWYGNNETRARAAHRAATESLNAIGALLETAVPYGVRLVVYRSEADGELAMRPRGRVFEELVVTGGQRVAPDLLLIFTPDSDVVRHEVAHIVTHVAGDGPFTSLPSWLDEGVAVFAQSSPGSGYASALEFGVATDTTLLLRNLQSPSNRPNEVNIFYGQSYSTVKFLIEEYGQERFAELFRVHFSGVKIDDALMEVYGFDQNGLNNAWRESKGLPPLALSSPASAATPPPAEATRVAIALPTAVAAGAAPTPSAATPADAAEPERAESGGGSNTAAGAAVALVTLVLASVLGAGALFLLRREKRGSS